MKLKETENLKLQILNNVQTTTTQKNHIQDSDTNLSDEITKSLSYTRKIQISKVNHCSNKGVTIVEDLDTSLLNADKISKTTKITLKSTEIQTNHFTST